MGGMGVRVGVGTGVHWPKWPETLQACPAPQLSVVQQTPSVQWLEVQFELMLHVNPFGAGVGV
jgi:hypothetical protein